MGESSKGDNAGERDATLIAPLPASTGTGSLGLRDSLTTSPGSGGESTPSAGRSRLAGRYEILGLLGVGGMGSVYRARDVELDEIVALKALRQELIDAPGMLDRFRREVKLARRVTHPNVARVFDIGEHEGGKFLTMEFVDGESLASLLSRSGPMPVARAIEIACAICAGLGAAHKAGVVHRDLKPDNVLMAKDGRVVVTDFGIARTLLDAGASQTVGTLVGTPAYMAPEQVEGVPDIDARADIYAFGALLYELFTAERPWVGDAPIAVAAARLVQPPPDPRAKRPELPTTCATVVLKCMARRREDRFADVAAIVSELSMLTMPAEAAVSVPAALRSIAPSGSMTLAPPPSLPRERPNDRSVAVLPFRNAGDPGDDYLAEELTDDLIDTLSMTPRLRVRSRGALQGQHGKGVDARGVGHELGVQVVVEGSVRKANGKVRVSARLISVEDGFQLWAKRFDRPEQDVLAINDEVAQSIASALTVHLDAPARDAPSDPVAVELYLRARHEYRKFWPEPMRQAVALFDQALARAPEDPLLLAGASLARARLSFFIGEGLEAAQVAAEKAVSVAPRLAEARLALANVALQYGDTARALRELKAAIARNAGLAEAHAALGRILIELGDLEDGLPRCEAALGLDVTVPLAASALARTAALLGDFEKVDAFIAQSIKSDGPTGGWTMRARAALWRRDTAAANEIAKELHGKPNTIVPQAILDLVLGRAKPASPRGSEIFTGAGGKRRMSFFSQIEAESCAFLDMREEALQAIERSVDAGLIDLLWLERCPVFDAELRATPSFQSSLARIRARAAELLAIYRSS